MNSGFVIAIDGPAAAGKGTIAPKLAENLHGFYLYTGAMYRALALFCMMNNVNVDNENSVFKILDSFHYHTDENGIYLNGENVIDKIKDSEVAMGSSKVATYPKIRNALVLLQQDIAKQKTEKGMIVVAEGRDTGTKVFPSAALKVFLTASPEVRAKRRLEQHKTRGDEIDFNRLLQEVNARDKQDSERKTDPLVSDPKNHGYFVLDNSNLDESQTLQKIIDELQKKGLIYDTY